MRPAGMMTDGELLRELETATGERQAALEAEQADRDEYRRHMTGADPSLCRHPVYCHAANGASKP